MPKDAKGNKVPLSLDESKRLKGSAFELAEAEKAKAKKEAEDKLTTTEDVVATRVDSPAPKTAKKNKPKTARKAVRNPVTGKAEKAPVTPLGAPVKRTADPVVRKFKKGELVVVKPRKQKKQTPIAKPQPGQAGKLDGELVRVTPENAEQVYEQRRRTELPKAGPAEMTPAGRPEVEQAILPSRLRGSQSGKNLGGFAQSHKIVAKATHEALDHLNTMATTDKGSSEHHSAHEAFNLLHGHIGQIGNKALHRDLGLGRTIIQQHHGSNKLPEALKIHRGIVLGRLEEGKIAEQARGERSGPTKGQ